ncbi:Tetratricopeptide repeat family [Mycena indigotica]|uniref:Tetratricopeptide repeat family n=1 Tax=Mycena indigotica TaxID=2126181 RepID=A0A8H6TDW1_9AGAR|nr:Tetratricopeptide repeat family [Mycena indigotica]KAF7315863.1 Tetratricopeptide repeat family [Mycena indigotica]
MDPISATTTLITLASFMKELVEIGHAIAASIEKVNENRRQIRDLTHEILHTLSDLANLTRGKQEFQTPALLSALGNLKADMLHVLEICRYISPVESKPGFRGLRSHVKEWVKRDDIETEIRRLKEHTNKCFVTFTAFSSARVEHATAHLVDALSETQDTTLRIEQQLIVNNVEGQVKLRRLESMMARILVETPFGQGVLERTIQVIALDPVHESLEAQYLSAQSLRLLPLVQTAVNRGRPILDASLWHSVMGAHPIQATTSDHVLYTILGVILQLQSDTWDMGVMNDCILRLGSRLRRLGMNSESVAWELFACQSLHRVEDEHVAVVAPRLAHAYFRLSQAYREQLQFPEAARATQQSVELWRHNLDTIDPFNNQTWFFDALTLHMTNLRDTNQDELILPIGEEFVRAARQQLGHTLKQFSTNDRAWTYEDKSLARQCCDAFFQYADSLASAKCPFDACEIILEGFEVFLQLPRHITRGVRTGPPIDRLLDQLSVLSETNKFSPHLLSKSVNTFRALCKHSASTFSLQFLRLLHAQVYTSVAEPSPDSSLPYLRAILEPTRENPIPSILFDNKSIYLPLGEVVEDAIFAFYTRPNKAAFVLIHNLFLAHPQVAIPAFRHIIRQINSLSSRDPDVVDWVLYSLDIFINDPINPSERRELLELMKMVWSFYTPQRENISLGNCSESWQHGLYIDTAGIFNRFMDALPTVTDWDEAPSFALIVKAATLWDAGRIQETLVTLTEIEQCVALPSQVLLEEQRAHDWYSLYCRIRCEALGRTKQVHDALSFLNTILSDQVAQPAWAGTESQNDLHYIVVYLERLALKRGMGELRAALTGVESVVQVCRLAPVADDIGNGYRLCALVHALVALGKCLDCFGRNTEALTACEEAVEICHGTDLKTWDSIMRTRCKKEVSPLAYEALSSQLAKANRFEALFYAQDAVTAYRELAALSPGYLPILAQSLLNLARILAEDDGIVDSVVTCAAAVEILRETSSKEESLLPFLTSAMDQLAQHRAQVQQIAPSDSETLASQPIESDISCGESDTSTLVGCEGVLKADSQLPDSTTPVSLVLIDAGEVVNVVDKSQVDKPNLSISEPPSSSQSEPTDEPIHDDVVDPRPKTWVEQTQALQMKSWRVEALWWALLGGLGGLVIVLSLCLAVILQRTHEIPFRSLHA